MSTLDDFAAHFSYSDPEKFKARIRGVVARMGYPAAIEDDPSTYSDLLTIDYQVDALRDAAEAADRLDARYPRRKARLVALKGLLGSDDKPRYPRDDA